MKTLLIDGKEYILDYSFGACFNTTLVKDMFNILTSSYYFRQEGEEKTDAARFFDSMSSQAADVPRIAFNAFYAGLKDNHTDITEDDAKKLLKIYMKDHKCNFHDVFDIEKEVMESDGFLAQSGVIRMIEDMSKNIEEVNNQIDKEQTITEVKKKKSTSTK